MITTVTLNAAVDKTYRVKAMLPGTVMRVEECIATAGGKGLNVARIIAAVGQEVNATGFLGGYNGQYVRSLLKGTGIEDEFFLVEGETRTCINVMSEDGTSTEYLEPGFTVNAQQADAFLKQFALVIEKSKVVTISGSMPKGCPEDFYKTLIQLAENSGKQVILDSSGAALTHGIKALPTLIKPNKDEIAALVQGEVTHKKAVEAAKSLCKEGIEYVVLSQGKEGATMVCQRGGLRAKAPKVEAVNPVGCGDSMVGALAVALQKKMPAAQMLAYAVEVSAASAMNEKTGGLSLRDYEAVQGQVTVEILEDRI